MEIGGSEIVAFVSLVQGFKTEYAVNLAERKLRNRGLACIERDVYIVFFIFSFNDERCV